MGLLKSGLGIRLVSAAMLVAVLAFGGCAGPGKVADAKGSQTSGPSVKVDEGSDLSDLAKAVKTPEDAMILDLLLGYRMLLLRNPDPKSLDKETLKKGRQAFERLEAALRHGGIRSKEGGERVFTVTSEDRLSLQEIIRSASEAAEKNAREGDWEKARARWKEIVQSKPSVTFSMEEAQWGLVLSDALQSSMPDSIKKRLKDVNESYAADISHDEISKQVKALLEMITDVKLQRELKKLANRCWEKDKRAGKVTTAPAVQTVPPELRPVGTDTAKLHAPVASAPAATPTPGASQTPASAAPVSPEGTGIGAEADTLASQGKYVAALKALDKAGEQSWVKEKKAQIGDRFCEEKRKLAANSFKDFKKAATDSTKRLYLKRTAADLDSCLFYFPELTVSQKVRKNREMVEVELKKLKP